VVQTNVRVECDLAQGNPNMVVQQPVPVQGTENLYLSKVLKSFKRGKSRGSFAGLKVHGGGGG
jgi:hypothetical protein